MKKILITFLLIGVAGCTTSGLEKKQPIYSGHSSKNVDEINRCLAPKWVGLKPSSTSVPTENGYQLSSSDDWIGAISLAKIDKADDGGSNVTVYVMSKGWNDPWGNAARSCI